MKMKYMIIIGVIAIIAIGAFCLLKNRGKENPNNPIEEDLDITKIKSLYITYSDGYAMNYYTRYELKNKNGIYTAKIKPHGVAEEEELETEIEKEDADKILNVLKKYHVEKWDGFDKTDKDVLDGDSFSFSLTLDNGKSIHASGYMMWPKNYSDVVAEISPVFMKIYNNKKGIHNDE